MCKWEATLYRCEHFTLRRNQPCVHGAGHPRCLGVEQLLFVLKTHEHLRGNGAGAVFEWCPQKCESIVAAGRHSEVVARSQSPGSGETDMEMLDKIYLLAGYGEEVKESDYATVEGDGVGFGDFLTALTVGLSRWNDESI